MTAAPLMFEPTDPPQPTEVPIDRDTFDSIVGRYGLTTEADACREYVELDGLVFIAPLGVMAS